jgi:hypothetical protein
MNTDESPAEQPEEQRYDPVVLSNTIRDLAAQLTACDLTTADGQTALDALRTDPHLAALLRGPQGQLYEFIVEANGAGEVVRREVRMLKIIARGGSA